MAARLQSQFPGICRHRSRSESRSVHHPPAQGTEYLRNYEFLQTKTYTRVHPVIYAPGTTRECSARLEWWGGAMLECSVDVCTPSSTHPGQHASAVLVQWRGATAVGAECCVDVLRANAEVLAAPLYQLAHSVHILTLPVCHLPLLSAAAIVKERIVSLLKDVRIVEEEAMDTS